MKGKIRRTVVTVVSAVILFAVCALSVYGLIELKKNAPSGSSGSSVPFAPADDPDPVFKRVEREPTITEGEAKKLAARKIDGSVKEVTDPSLLTRYKVDLPYAGNLSKEGYKTTDKIFDAAVMKMAVMTPNFDFPAKFSLRDKTVSKNVTVQNVMYGEFEASVEETAEARPALDVYMGYVVADDGEKLTLYSTEGKKLLSFDDTVYVPAYERDLDGVPLFKRTVVRQTGVYDCEGLKIKVYAEGDPDREGERVHLAKEPDVRDRTVFVEGELVSEGQGNQLTEIGSEYYRVSYDGSYFAASDFDELTDSRGVKFDYPAQYGTTDALQQLSVTKYRLYEQDLYGRLKVTRRGDWTYKVYGTPITDRIFERAYNFSEGLGCVLTEPYRLDGGLFFIDRSGNRAFATSEQYRDNTGRIIIDTYLGPVTYGEESIGYFYYDHGLVRVRVESIDGNNFLYDGRIRYLSTKEILIDLTGKRFPTPEGYEIRAYSDGIILLEKNGKYGYMDYTGDWIAEPVYAAARPFSEGLGVLTTADGAVGVIDTKGNIVVPFEYSFISECSDGIMTAFSEGTGWRIIRKMTPS